MSEKRIKLLISVIVVLNFYNPLVYYLMRKWNHVIELCCDEEVIACKNKKEIQEYGMLILKMAEERKDSNFMPIAGMIIVSYEEQLGDVIPDTVAFPEDYDWMIIDELGEITYVIQEELEIEQANICKH